ncbi:unnamed protein product [Camellia sinensis]
MYKPIKEFIQTFQNRHNKTNMNQQQKIETTFFDLAKQLRLHWTWRNKWTWRHKWARRTECRSWSCCLHHRRRRWRKGRLVEHGTRIRIRIRIWVGTGKRRLRLVAGGGGVAGAFVGVANAVTKQPETQEKSSHHKHCHYEDEDLRCFPHITHFFFRFLFFSFLFFSLCWLC